MTFWPKMGTIIVILLFLSSCSWFSNRFGKDDDCPAGACDDSNVLDEVSGIEKWYCYGVQEDRSWDCDPEFQPEKVRSIDPSAVRQAPPVIEPLPVIGEAQPVNDPDPQSAASVLLPTSTALTSTPPGSTPPTSAATGSEQGGDFILGQPAEDYTVQLITMPDEASLLAYASQNGMDAPLYARVKGEASDWYVLLLGTYSDMQSADEARESWEKTRAFKFRPEVRKLGPLQEAIRLARN